MPTLNVGTSPVATHESSSRRAISRESPSCVWSRTRNSSPPYRATASDRADRPADASPVARATGRRRVPAGVVDVLEVIDVDQATASRPAATLDERIGVAPAPDSGQRVAQRLFPEGLEQTELFQPATELARQQPHDLIRHRITRTPNAITTAMTPEGPTNGIASRSGPLGLAGVAASATSSRAGRRAGPRHTPDSSTNNIDPVGVQHRLRRLAANARPPRD